MIAPIKLKRLIDLINAGKEHEFYTWGEWLKSREDVLKLDHYECQRCKDVKHKYRKAKIVHHVKHLRSRPDLALSIWDEETGERQLISVCKQCREELHPESQRQFKNIRAPITEERWD